MPQEEIRKIIISDMVKKRNSIVPVIGEEMIVYKENGNGKEIPFQEFILNEFQKKYSWVTVDDVALTSMKERGYYGLSLLSQYYNVHGYFLDDFIDFVSKNASCIKLKDEVFDFLVTFKFPIIITTVCFDIIEQKLKMIEDYKSIWYNPDSKNDSLPQKCVYHIFGQAKDGTKWVYDEDSLLTFLLSHNDKDHGATGLMDFLKVKKLFMLGCNLPNWLFRFLWRLTQEGKKGNDDEMKKTKQGYWVNKEKPEDSFKNFLEKKNFADDDQVKDILVDATKLLKEEFEKEEKERSSMIDTEEHFDVFISYASEDRQIATAIFKALKNMNIKAWFDDSGEGEITPGQKYWERIESGIKHSAHFMPIITSNWMHKLTNTSSLKEETYMVRDWLAECRKKEANNPLKANYSIPVIIQGSVYNDEPITSEYVEQASRWFLPKTLFDKIDMITFDERDFSVFEKIEW